MMRLQLKNGSFIKNYPVGVGGFSMEGEYLTPNLTSNFYLSKQYNIKNRRDKPYFKGEPFLRIMKYNGNSLLRTPFGLHISQGSKYKTNDVNRGFVSHGCIRMRAKDLREIYELSLNSQFDIPVRIQFNKFFSEAYHPYPLNNSYVKKETPEDDNYGLSIMEESPWPFKRPES